MAVKTCQTSAMYSTFFRQQSKQKIRWSESEACNWIDVLRNQFTLNICLNFDTKLSRVNVAYKKNVAIKQGQVIY